MVKKLKIYNGSKVLSKAKLIKKKVILSILVISCTALMYACSGKQNQYSDIKTSFETTYTYENNTTNSNSINNTEVVVDNNISDSDEVVYGEVEKDYVTINEKSLIGFDNYLNSIDTKYDYSELFNTKAALDRYETNKYDINITHSSDLLRGSSNIDSNKLYSVVKENNETYLEKHSSSMYKELSKKEVQRICEIVAETINAFIKTNPEIDLNELSCNLGNLKIFSKNSGSNAFISVDNCLVVSPHMLNILEKMNKNTDAYKETIMHEAVHIIQRSCDDDEKNNPGKNIGISYKWVDFDVNPLDFNWFYEASAEKCRVNLTKSEPLVYQNMINYLESLSFSTILNDKVSVNQTENLNLQKNLDKLFEQFNCKTEKEKIEIINMMMSINIIQAEPNDFEAKYQTIYGKDLTNDVDLYGQLKCVIKPEVMETLTKVFYRNLANEIASNMMTLQDSFFLIKTFENDINSHIKYSDDSYSISNETFIKNYVAIQDEFFYMLSLNGDYSQTDIESKFNNYKSVVTNKTGAKENNYSLVWISDSKAEYLEDYSKKMEIYSSESIRSYNEKLYGNSKSLKK